MTLVDKQKKDTRVRNTDETEKQHRRDRNKEETQKR